MFKLTYFPEAFFWGIPTNFRTMITFFDKKTQDFLTVYTKFPVLLINKFREQEEQVRQIYEKNFPHRPILTHLNSIIKFFYYIYSHNKAERYILLTDDDKDEIISWSDYYEFTEMLSKYGSVDNVGRVLYYQKDPVLIQEILKEYDITVSFNPSEEFEAMEKIQIGELLDSYPNDLQNFENVLHSFAEVLSKISEVTQNKELLETIDTLFSQVERIYVNSFDDIYNSFVLHLAFSILTFGVLPPWELWRLYDFNSIHLARKLCAKILKHPMLYHFYFKEIIKDQGIHNDFFYQNPSNDG